MNTRDFPECPSWRGFGWRLSHEGEPIRVLGNDGQRVRVEYLEKRNRPRAWLALSLPVFRGLARWIATGPEWPNPGLVREEPAKIQPSQVGLFRPAG